MQQIKPYEPALTLQVLQTTIVCVNVVDYSLHDRIRCTHHIWHSIGQMYLQYRGVSVYTNEILRFTHEALVHD